MKIESMRDLLLEQIQDLYDAEQRLTKALPKMAEASTSPELRRAFESHLDETRGHVTRLEQAFQAIGEEPEAKTCDAMKGLIKEGDSVAGDIEQSPLRDAALIAAANRVEHYEIAAYGSAREFALSLGMDKVAALLQQTLMEEKAADQKLTSIAKTIVNEQALQMVRQ
jgi:ferritin-like metal-binding protein YciE